MYIYNYKFLDTPKYAPIILSLPATRCNDTFGNQQGFINGKVEMAGNDYIYKVAPECINENQ